MTKLIGRKSTSSDESFRQKRLTADTPFAIREAYNTLRTNILFSGAGESGRVYVLTSAMPNDGKTINSLNTAIAFAQMGKRVLLLDGDLRNSYMHRYFSFPDKAGLSEFLAGIQSDPLIRPTSEENLFVLTAGAVPPNPAELLGSERMEKLLMKLRSDFDFIFIDTPPLEMVADASVLANRVDGYIFVVKSGSTDQAMVRHSLSMLDQVDGKVIGFLLNNTSMKSRNYYRSYKKKYGYSYKYGYKYGHKNSYGYGKSSKSEK